MSVQELKNNKLRSGLSLIGISFGIFCIIGVLATVGSLENKLQTDIKALGSNTIYIDKWQYGGGPDYPWWKYVNRPVPRMDEVKFIKEKASLAQNVCYFNSNVSNVVYENNQMNNVGIYCASEEFNSIQTIDIAYGRYLNETEFLRGNPVCVIGYVIAEQLFGKPEKALDKSVTFEGKRMVVAGVIKKQGQNIVDGYDYDHCVLLGFRNFASIYDVSGNYTNSVILVNGKPNVPVPALIDELKGVMRQIRKLGPTDEDNFALNDINFLSQQISGFFGSVNVGGWFIAGLSLVVGLFGVANIMFVTVRERTGQIGLKKAVGAKKRTILTEFLLESAFLCIVGGLLGLLFVWILTSILSTVLPFSVSIAPGIIILAFSLCIGLGVLSGIIPANIAAKMDPVVAIRSK